MPRVRFPTAQGANKKYQWEVLRRRRSKAIKTKLRVAHPKHTWKVTRRDGQSVSVNADDLSVVDGELVFATNKVPVRIVAADTYTDVEIVVAGD
jgi:hypothetical protein